MGKKKKKAKEVEGGVPVYAPPCTYLDDEGNRVHYPGTPLPAPSPPRLFDRVAIVGFHPDTMKLAPIEEEGWECWGFNPPAPWHLEYIHRFDRWFDLHDIGIHEIRRPWYVEWLKGRDRAMEEGQCPVLYTQEGSERPGYREALRFPKEEIEALAPHGTYHAGSFDWLMGMAILLGFPDIWIYGVRFYAAAEPYSARSCLEYWCGVAEGQGLRVHVDEIGDPAQEILRNCTPEDFETLSEGSPQYGWETANWLTVEEELRAVLSGRMLSDPWDTAPDLMDEPDTERSD